MKRMLMMGGIVAVMVLCLRFLPFSYGFPVVGAGMVYIIGQAKRYNQAALAALEEPEPEEEEALLEEWLPFIQSPEVDKVLSRYYVERNFPSDKVPELDAAKAWSDYGLGQVRALLHQSLDEPCNDGQIVALCRPVWLLAWVHARKDVQDMEKRHRKAMDTEQKKYDALQPQIQAALDSVERERQDHQREIERHQKKFDALRAGFTGQNLAHEEAVRNLNQQIAKLSQENALLRLQLEAVPEKEEPPVMEPEEAQPLTLVKPDYKAMPTAERNALILQYLSEGHTNVEAAKEFGLTAGLIGQIKCQAKKQTG